MDVIQLEQRLLARLANGELDGLVGDEREYRSHYSVLSGKLIRNGIPICYWHGIPNKKDTKVVIPISPNRTEEIYDTDEQKLEFLQQYGWLMNDKEVRVYSNLFKYRRLTKR